MDFLQERVFLRQRRLQSLLSLAALGLVAQDFGVPAKTATFVPHGGSHPAREQSAAVFSQQPPGVLKSTVLTSHVEVLFGVAPSSIHFQVEVPHGLSQNFGFR